MHANTDARVTIDAGRCGPVLGPAGEVAAGAWSHGAAWLS